MQDTELVEGVALCFNSVVFKFQLPIREYVLKEDYDV